MINLKDLERDVMAMLDEIERERDIEEVMHPGLLISDELRSKEETEFTFTTEDFEVLSGAMDKYITDKYGEIAIDIIAHHHDALLGYMVGFSAGFYGRINNAGELDNEDLEILAEALVYYLEEEEEEDKDALELLKKIKLRLADVTGAYWKCFAQA